MRPGRYVMTIFFSDEIIYLFSIFDYGMYVYQFNFIAIDIFYHLLHNGIVVFNAFAKTGRMRFDALIGRRNIEQVNHPELFDRHVQPFRQYFFILRLWYQEMNGAALQ